MAKKPAKRSSGKKRRPASKRGSTPRKTPKKRTPKRKKRATPKRDRKGRFVSPPLHGARGRFVARRSVEALEMASAVLRDACGPDWIDLVTMGPKFGYGHAVWSIVVEGPSLHQSDAEIALDSAAGDPTFDAVMRTAKRVIVAVRLISVDEDGEKVPFGWRTTGFAESGDAAIYQSAANLRTEFRQKYTGELWIDSIEVVCLEGGKGVFENG